MTWNPTEWTLRRKGRVGRVRKSADKRGGYDMTIVGGMTIGVGSRKTKAAAIRWVEREIGKL